MIAAIFWLSMSLKESVRKIKHALPRKRMPVEILKKYPNVNSAVIILVKMNPSDCVRKKLLPILTSRLFIVKIFHG
jgi:hypothetical protein